MDNNSHPFGVFVTYHSSPGYVLFVDTHEEAENSIKAIIKAVNDGVKVIMIADDLALSLEGVRDITIKAKPDGYTDTEWISGKSPYSRSVNG